MKDYELLRRGADLIEQRGLARYALEDQAGGLCFYGALLTVIFGSVKNFDKMMSNKDSENPLFNGGAHVALFDASAAVGEYVKTTEVHTWSNQASNADEVVSVMRHVADTLNPQLIEPPCFSERELVDA